MENVPLLPDRVIRAVVRLLADEDREILRVCRRRLLSLGDAVRPALQWAADQDEPRLRVHARAMLRSLQLDEWARELARLGHMPAARDFDNPQWLESALLRIAQLGRDRGLGPADIGQRLDDLADELWPLVRGRSSVTAARRLAHVLAGKHGFSGCESRYYASDNAFLDRVLETRRGLPEALVALYILVGRRVGLRVSAVRLPDYFLVRVHGCRRVLLDPFHGGRTVTRTDCLRFLRDTGTAYSAFARLSDVDDVDLLIGLLDNLIRIHDRRQDGEFRSAIRRARRALSQRSSETFLA